MQCGSGYRCMLWENDADAPQRRGVCRRAIHLSQLLVWRFPARACPCRAALSCACGPLQLAVKQELRKMGASMISMASLSKMGEAPAGAGQRDEGAPDKKRVSEKVHRIRSPPSCVTKASRALPSRRAGGWVDLRPAREWLLLILRYARAYAETLDRVFRDTEGRG